MKSSGSGAATSTRGVHGLRWALFDTARHLCLAESFCVCLAPTGSMRGTGAFLGDDGGLDAKRIGRYRTRRRSQNGKAP